MLRRAPGLVVLLIALLVAAVVYQRLQTRIAAQVYRQRLEMLGRSYEQLRLTYNQAVRRTAVTELLVDGGRLSVVIRTAAGVRRVVDTPFDPYGEVFVDYVVVEGRLLIRRVFDARTPPSEAMVFDSLLEEIDWDGPGVACGKAVYRRLDEGRWVVTVTGDGSLGLARCPDGGPVELTPSPPVQDYPQLQEEIGQDLERVGVVDVLSRWLGSWM